MAAWPAMDRASALRQLWRWRMRAAELWWQPLRSASMTLRRTRADDANFYSQCFESPDFKRRFNRQVPWTGDLAQALAQAGAGSPLDQRAIHWIIEIEPSHRVGLASLTSISMANARAEVSLGFPGQVPPLLGAMAMLLIYDFAFFKLGLNKLSSCVYTSNAEALHNSRRVGLRQEGELKDHFYLPPGEFVDVYVMGLTRAQLQADDRLVQMARRRLGLHWAPRPGAQSAGLTPPPDSPPSTTPAP